MSDLVGFSNHVKEQLASANREPYWEPGEADRYMADADLRHHRFDELTVRLNDTVIQPRLEIVASHFANASLTTGEPPGHCVCWFGYCERFPASAKVAIAVEHDIRFERVAVCYDSSMMPAFFKFNEHDRLAFSLGEVIDDEIADWVEERLAEFLDAYLRIDRGGEDFKDEVVTDPVCGMRISHSSAKASDAYRGHPYYFCSTDCRDEFAREPTAYVQVKTM